MTEKVHETVRLDEPVAIVTGAAGGTGRAVAEELGRRGATIVAVDHGGDTTGQSHNSTVVGNLVEELQTQGVRAHGISTTIGTASAARGIVSEAVDVFGRVDALVNIAGTSLPGPMDSATDEEVEDFFQLDLLGAYHLVRAVWPPMRDQSYGRILNTSSNAAFGVGANALYGTTRAALIGMTFDNAIEGRPHNVMVNAMMPAAFSRLIAGIPNPAYVEWFRQNLPTEEVAAGIAYFLSRDSSTSGQLLSVGGGRVA